MKIQVSACLVLGLFSGLMRPCIAGSVEGTILLPPPKAERKLAARYASALRPKPVPPDPSAVVYLESTRPYPSAEKAADAAMVQKGYRFQPSVLPVRVGTRVSFPNKDPDYHNVFSYSKAKVFDLGRYRKSEDPPTVHFDKAGEVKLFCEIHRHMRGVILVLETPYFAATDKTGDYRISDVPAGDYTLTVWFQSRAVHTQDVTVRDGAASVVDLNTVEN